MSASFDSLLNLDAQWSAAGHHALTPFWNATASKLLTHPTARTLIARVGRGGAKSFTSAKFGVNEVLAGDWAVPPGERHYFAYVSRLKEEVSQRRLLLESFLRSLDVPFDTAGDEIALRDLPLGFRFFACSVAAVTGFRCIGYVADEVAKWESTDSYKNPASEVIASLNAMCVTHPEARQFLISSPWSTDDEHAARFELGDTDAQVVVQAASWVANPSITEERTRKLEPDPRVWSREYAAVPGQTLTAAFDPADVAACFDRNATGKQSQRFVSIDASSLRGDAFTWMAGFTSTEGELAVGDLGGWEGAELRRVSMHGIVGAIAERCDEWETRTVYGDQREEASLGALFSEHDIGLTSIAWTEQSKDDAVMILRRLMREGKLCLIEHATLKRELGSMKARLLPSGRIRYETNGLDYASALITAAHAIADGHLGLGGDSGLAEAEQLSRECGAESRWDGFGGNGYG